jgi:hypothetical protein
LRVFSSCFLRESWLNYRTMSLPTYIVSLRTSTSEGLQIISSLNLRRNHGSHAGVVISLLDRVRHLSLHHALIRPSAVAHRLRTAWPPSPRSSRTEMQWRRSTPFVQHPLGSWSAGCCSTSDRQRNEALVRNASLQRKQ